MSSSSRNWQRSKVQGDQNLKKDIREMVIKVMEQREDWRKHLHGNCCKCQKCTCGKHRCKVRPIQMSLQPTLSTYCHDYTPKKVNLSSRMKTPELQRKQDRVMNGTTYKHDYPMKRATSQPNAAKKAKDNIELGGPMFALSSYQQQFTMKEASNPQKIMRNLNNLGALGMKMNASSSYRDAFQWKKKANSSRPQALKRENNLKLNPQATFRNVTSYGKDFTQRKLKGYQDKSSFAPHQAYQTIKSVRPQSSYRRQFIQMHPTICPAASCDLSS